MIHYYIFISHLILKLYPYFLICILLIQDDKNRMSIIGSREIIVTHSEKNRILTKRQIQAVDAIK